MLAYARLLRPKQWIKNLLVFTVPFAAGELLNPEVLLTTFLTFVLFCAISSSIYIANDTLDREGDRLHPTKRKRPIASGQVSIPAAIAIAAVLAAIALVVPILLGLSGLWWVIVIYAVIQIFYVFWGKHQIILDILIVATGFGLRGVAGGLANSIPVSEWFVLVLSSASLLIVAGKRYSEVLAAERNPDAHIRRTLQQYTPSFLRFIWVMAATLAVLSYSLWAFQITGLNQWISLASVMPFLAGILFYVRDIDSGNAETPEDIFFRDRGLLVAGVVWVLVFSAAMLFPESS